MNKLTKKIKKTINDMDKILLIISIAMIGFGLLNIVTASSREAVSLKVSLYYYFYRHLAMVGIGLILAIIILSLPTFIYKKIGVFLMGLIAAFMIYSLIFAISIRGAKNWSVLWGFRFQPSEFVKPLGIVTLACLYDKYYRKIINEKVNHTKIIVKIVIVSTFIPIIVFLQNDFGTMFIQLVIFWGMFMFSPFNKKEKFKTVGVLTILTILAIGIIFIVRGEFFTKTQLARLSDFTTPCRNYEEGGYQVCNGIIAINGGGLFGLGIGKSKQKYSYIPEPHTDFVFSIIAEEYGFIRVTPIFIAYIIILHRIMLLASTASTIRGKYICFGVGVYLFTHIFINLGGLLAIIPLTGVPLPFLSYGGSYTISLLVALALVQRVHIETRNTKIKIK